MREFTFAFLVGATALSSPIGALADLDSLSEENAMSCKACACMDKMQCLVRLDYLFENLESETQDDLLKQMFSDERSDLCYIGDVLAANCNEVLYTTFNGGGNPTRLTKLLSVCDTDLDTKFDSLVSAGVLTEHSSCDESQQTIVPVGTSSITADSFTSTDSATTWELAAVPSTTSSDIMQRPSSTVAMVGIVAMAALGISIISRRRQQLKDRQDFMPL